MGREVGAAVTAVFRTRPLALALAVGLWTLLGALVVLGSGPHAGARAADSAITCTNLASGTQWQIRINYERSTVDSYPARISDTNITWHDTSDGANYTLDRKSGNLTVVVASSTGGYFLNDRCKLEN
jgi:glucose dehydrogenase